MIRQPKLMEILSVVPLLPSGMNAQTLRFRPVPSEQAQRIHPLVRLGAALPEEHLPHSGQEPQRTATTTSRNSAWRTCRSERYRSNVKRTPKKNSGENGCSE